jgi:hypothetical protein
MFVPFFSLEVLSLHRESFITQRKMVIRSAILDQQKKKTIAALLILSTQEKTLTQSETLFPSKRAMD